MDLQPIFNSSLEGKLFKAIKEVDLKDLKGGISFSPKFNGIPFILKDNKIYKRGPHQADYYIEIRKRDMVPELRLNKNKDVVKAIEYSTNNDNLIEDLKKTGKFFIKKISSLEEKFLKVTDKISSKDFVNQYGKKIYRKDLPEIEKLINMGSKISDKDAEKLAKIFNLNPFYLKRNAGVNLQAKTLKKVEQMFKWLKEEFEEK